MTIEFTVHPLTSELSGFVYETWTRDYSRQPSMRRMPQQAYYPYQRGVVAALLGRPGTSVLVAHDAEDHDQVYGWVCSELEGGTFVLHYVYVKRPFRELGIGHALLSEALERAGDVSELVYTHDPARGRDEHGRIEVERRRQAEALGFGWRPIDEHLRGASGRAA